MTEQLFESINSQRLMIQSQRVGSRNQPAIGEDYPSTTDEEQRRKINETFSNIENRSLPLNDRPNQNGVSAQNGCQRSLVCEICLNEVKEEMMRSIDRCSHLFCFRCLEKHIKERLIPSITVIACPSEECSEFFKQASPIYYELDEKTKRMFRKKEVLSFILKNPAFHLCKTDECEGKFQVSKDKKGSNCDTCNAAHCQKCFDLKHNNACNKDLITHFLNKEFLRQCKKCKFIIEKSQGCNHITCRCGYQFCYSCGQDFVGNHSCQNSSISLYQQLHRSLILKQPRYFQHNSINLRSLYRYFRLNPEMSDSQKFMKGLLFTLIIYPLILVYGILLLMVRYLLVPIVFFLFLLLLPFINIKDNTSIGNSIQLQIERRHNRYIACLFVLLFYPLLLFHGLYVYTTEFGSWFVKKICRITLSNEQKVHQLAFWVDVKTSIEYIGITILMPCFIL